MHGDQWDPDPGSKDSQWVAWGWVPREQRPLLPRATHIQGSLPALPGQGAGCGRRPGREGQAGRVTGSPPEVAGVLPPPDRQGPQGCSLAGTAGVRQEGLHLLGLRKFWGAGAWWWPQLPGAPVAGPGSPSEPEHAPVPTALLAQSGLLATRLLSDPVTWQFGHSAQPGRGARRAGCCCPLVAAAGRALRLGRPSGGAASQSRRSLLPWSRKEAEGPGSPAASRRGWACSQGSEALPWLPKYKAQMHSKYTALQHLLFLSAEPGTSACQARELSAHSPCTVPGQVRAAGARPPPGHVGHDPSH